MQVLLQELSLARIERKAVDSIPLPPPTTAPVDPVSMQHILEFDPERGAGDFLNGLAFGVRPKLIADRAFRSAKRLLPNFLGHNDDQDAVRHALGSFLLTKRYGAAAAKAILDGHERRPGIFTSGRRGSPGEVLQDLYNNRVAREAALDPKNKGKKPEQIVMELYRAGKLQTRPFLIR